MSFFKKKDGKLYLTDNAKAYLVYRDIYLKKINRKNVNPFYACYLTDVYKLLDPFDVK